MIPNKWPLAPIPAFTGPAGPRRHAAASLLRDLQVEQGDRTINRRTARAGRAHANSRPGVAPRAAAEQRGVSPGERGWNAIGGGSATATDRGLDSQSRRDKFVTSQPNHSARVCVYVRKGVCECRRGGLTTAKQGTRQKALWKINSATGGGRCWSSLAMMAVSTRCQREHGRE